MATNPHDGQKTGLGPSYGWRTGDRINLKRWRTVRRRVLARDGYRCRRCGRAGRLEVDHVRPLADFPHQSAYDPAGLQALCRGCHIRKTKAENAARYPVRPDVAAWSEMVRELYPGN